MGDCCVSSVVRWSRRQGATSAQFSVHGALLVWALQVPSMHVKG